MAEAFGQLDLDGFFHIAGQLAHDVVEQAHLDLAVVLAGEEQVGNAAQQFAALGAGRFVGQGDQIVKAGLHQKVLSLASSPFAVSSASSGAWASHSAEP